MTDFSVQAVATAPPVAVTTWIWFGHTPEQWVSVLTVRDEWRKRG